MNTHTEYRHRPEWHHPESSNAPGSEAVDAASADHLALSGDPSLATAPARSSAGQALPGMRIAWVRPTEFAAHASPLIGRGIDLHAELIRRTRTAPHAAKHAVQRTVDQHTLDRTISPAATRTTPDQKGIQL